MEEYSVIRSFGVEGGTERCDIDVLPDEILEYLLYMLSPYNDLAAVRLVCKRWYRITSGIVSHKFCNFRKSLREGVMQLLEIKTPVGEMPHITERYSHCACYYKKAMYIFGGCTSPNATFNNIWKFDLSTRKWHKPLAMGNYPQPKACSSMVTYNNCLILFGGWSHPTPFPLHQAAHFFSELHMFYPEANQWIHTATQNSPPPTAGHSACMVQGSMVVFGGSHGQNNSCNDIWVLDVAEKSWLKIYTGEPQPLPRYGQAQVLVDDKHILIVGGCGGPNMVFNDAWLLEMGERWKWHQINVQNPENTPLIWCRDIVKVGDMLVTISKGSRTSREKMTIRRPVVPHNPPVKPVQTSKQTMLKFYSSSDTDSSESADETNVQRHQQKRTFSRQYPGNRSSIDQDARSSQNKRVEMGAPFRPGPPSIRPNATSNRQKQLEMLKRYEDRIRRTVLSRLSDPVMHEAVKAEWNFENTLLLHVLDISELITNHQVSWLEVSEIPTHVSPSSEEILFYSLVDGRGELIMFGGLRTDPNTMHMSIGKFAVTNDLFILSPLKKYLFYIVFT